LSPTTLREIAIFLPPEPPGATACFAALADLLGEAPNCSRTDNGNWLSFTPQQPADALPKTTFGLLNLERPTILFDTELPIDVPIGGVHLRSRGAHSREYPAMPITPQPDLALLPAANLRDRLRGHIRRVDHFGVNLPTSIVARPAWDDLLSRLGAISALYRYPGEEWPFIIPATAAEHTEDIRVFVAGREPKFELVYDAYTAVPIIQISIETDLTQAELTALLPAPYGLGLGGLEHLFRTVYLDHPWPDFALRIDLSFRNDGPATDWDTGEWLVTQGGRMR
jgi:hypothetical protein